VVSQRSRAEVRAEATVAANRVASPETLSRLGPPPAARSGLSRAEVRQAAINANRAGELPELSAY
jgi:hypothetical protein